MEIEFIPIKKQHLEQMIKWRNSGEINKYMYSDKEISLEEQNEWYKAMQAKLNEKHWIIICDSNPVGVVNLKCINFIDKTAEWAFYVAEKEAREKGAGIIVEYKIIEYAFHDLGLHKLKVTVLAFNILVIKLHKKFGFMEEEIKKDYVMKSGKWEDIVVLSLSLTDWEKHKIKMEGIVKLLGKNN